MPMNQENKTTTPPTPTSQTKDQKPRMPGTTKPGQPVTGTVPGRIDEKPQDADKPRDPRYPAGERTASGTKPESKPHSPVQNRQVKPTMETTGTQK